MNDENVSLGKDIGSGEIEEWKEERGMGRKGWSVVGREREQSGGSVEARQEDSL